MINLDDINDAEDKINELFRVRDEIVKASPYLNDILANLSWTKKVCSEIPEKANDFLELIQEPIKSTLSLNSSNLDYSFVTGATGSYHAVSADTREIIKTYGSQHYNLITEYETLFKTEDLIDRIIEGLSYFRVDLIKYRPIEILLEAKEAYAKWKAGSKDNSDLAKDIRAYQDVFNGVLNMAKLATYNVKPKGKPDNSWPKMTEVLGKEGGGCKKTFKNLQSKEDELHLAFTEIMKKTRNVSNPEMETLFKDYIEHAYSIINLINMDLFQ
jgi:hypothetical protein